MLELLAIFGAGLATLATPCILPLVPVYLAMLLGDSVSAVRSPAQRARLVVTTLAFSLGFSAVFVGLGLGASLLGGLLSAHRPLLTVAGAAVIALFGFKFLGLVRVDALDRDLRLSGPARLGSPLRGLLFGVVFALGWTPCAGPVLASVLSVAALEQSSARAAGLLALYSAGLALPLLLVATFADRLLPLLRRLNRHLGGLQRATGAVMLLAALWIGVPAALELGHGAAADRSVLTASGQTLPALLGAPTDRPRLIELVEQDCPVCQRMHGRIEALRQSCHQQQVDVITVDLGQPRNRGLRSQLGVQAVPSLILVDRSGQEVARLVGERSLDQLRGLAASLQEQACAGVAPIDARALAEGESCQEASGSSGAAEPASCG